MKTSDVQPKSFLNIRDLQKEENIFKNLNQDTFWEFIDYTKQLSKGDKEEQVNLIVEILSERDDNDIVTFMNISDWYHRKSYTGKLWAVPYAVNSGCSDDSFSYFRSWLISEGKEKFDNLNGDLENLPDLYDSEDDIVGFSEEYNVMFYEIVERKYPDNESAQIELERKNDNYTDKELIFDFPEINFEWEDENDIQKLYPKFYEKFGEKKN